jgi:hypothetical protein
MTDKPEKTKGQTDRRILGLSFKDFEEEFGFKPADKIEQRYFATHRERPDEEQLERLKGHSKVVKDVERRRQ